MIEGESEQRIRELIDAGVPPEAHHLACHFALWAIESMAFTRPELDAETYLAGVNEHPVLAQRASVGDVQSMAYRAQNVGHIEGEEATHLASAMIGIFALVLPLARQVIEGRPGWWLQYMQAPSILMADEDARAWGGVDGITWQNDAKAGEAITHDSTWWVRVDDGGGIDDYVEHLAATAYWSHAPLVFASHVAT
jgi:hypothetical protein